MSLNFIWTLVNDAISYGHERYASVLLPTDLVSRVFNNGRGLIPDWVIPNIQKWYLILPCLTLRIIKYGSKVAIQRKELRLLLLLSVVANEKRFFGSP